LKQLQTLVLFLVLSTITYGQFPVQPSPTGSVNTLQKNAGAYEVGRGIVITNFADTTAANAVSYMKGTPYIEIRTSDNRIWRRNVTATQWVQLGGSGGGGNDSLAYYNLIQQPDSLYAVFEKRNGNKDTLTILGVAGSGIDTTSLSNRINLKVNIADTASMLTPYAKTAALAAKLNISDTATMLTPYSRVKSIGLSMPSAFNVANSPLTSNGTLAVTGAGTASQYVRGDGQLANFPSNSGSGSSVAYYLNGSVSQGTFGGDTYYELSKTPVFGAGTNFIRTSAEGNGYIASFITDAGDPSLLSIPAGNWTLEFYFNANSNGGTPRFYGELYKVDSSNVFTLIASESANPEFITNGTAIDQYFTSISVPQTTLLVTDRLAIRIFVIPTTRTITLHTENSNLSEVITTFSSGLTALNGLTAQVQYFATGTSGTDFAISSATDTHTFNLPTASATNRGALSSADWSTFNGKTTVSSYGKNAGGDSTILVLSNGTRFAARDSIGGASQWTTTGSDIYYGTGKVGITTSVGTMTPLSLLHLQDSLSTIDSTKGLILENKRLAVVNVGRESMPLILKAQGWGTSGTPSSRPSELRILNIPTSSSNPLGDLYVQRGVAGVYSTIFQVTAANGVAGPVTYNGTNELNLLTSGSAGNSTMNYGGASLGSVATRNYHNFNGSITSTANNAATIGFMEVKPTVNMPTSAGASYMGLRINVTETVAPAGQSYLFRAGKGGASFVSNFDITNTGQVMIGNATPNASAALNITSTTQGVLLPRMDSTQRNAIPTPATGLQVYNTNTNAFNYYNGTAWTAIGGGGGGSGWGLTGNASAVTDFLGTTNNRTMRFRTNNVERMVIDSVGTVRVTNDAVINGMTVGRGTGNYSGNTALGFQTLFSNTSGTATDNTAIGYTAMRANTTGGQNSAFGQGALYSNTTGLGNMAFGREALYFNTTGNQNIGIGVGALYFGGTNTTAIGAYSGYFTQQVDGDDNFINNTGANSGLYIGANIKTLNVSQTNEIIIGNDGLGLGSNTTVIGNSSTTTTALKGNVLVGTQTSDATAALNVSSTSSGVLIPRMTTSQRNVIGGGIPATGLQIYNTDEKRVEYYNSNFWTSVGNDDDTDVKLVQALGSQIKAQTYKSSEATTSQSLVSGTLRLVAVYLQKPQLITGVQIYLSVAGSFTANNNNKLGLYSVNSSTGVITKVAETANDVAGNIWKGSSGVSKKVAFTAPYNANAGVYYIAMLYNTSSQISAPAVLSRVAFAQNVGLMDNPTFLSFSMISSAAQTDLLSSYSTVGAEIGATTANIWGSIY
jgi:hypothetical protein